MSTNVREEVVKLIIDGKQVTGSYNELKKSQREIIKNLRGMEAGSKEYNKESMKLNRVNAELDKVDGNIKKISKTFNQQKSIWDQAKAQFAGTFAAFTVAGAVQQIGQLGARMVSFIKDLTAHRQEITRLTGVTGRDLDVLSAKIQSVVDTYDKDFNEVLIAGNALANQMGISHAEALDIIKKGFAAGADANGEFLDKLKEYPAQLKTAGLTADESIALMSQEVKTGIYSDKGIDTIKEGTLRLREMADATREALEGIGISSKELEEQLRSGTITYFEAIQMVSDKLGDLEEQSPEVGTAIADIFGGAGEDAGIQYLKMLADVNTELVNLETPTTKLADANERLALMYQTLADDDGLFTKLEIGMKDAGAAALGLLNIFNDGGFWKGIQAIMNPSAAGGIMADVAARKAYQEDLAANPPGPQQIIIPSIIIPKTPTSITPKTPGASSSTADITKVEAFTNSLEKIKTAQLDLDQDLAAGRKAYMDLQAENFAAEQEQHAERMRMKEQELAMQQQLIESTILQGMQSVQSADSAADYGKAIAAQAKAQIQAAIAKGIAEAIASQLGTGPLGIFTAAAAGIAAQGIFNSIVPSFSVGGDTGYGDLGLGRNAGGYIRGVIEEGEYVVPASQRNDPYQANTERYLEGRRKFGSSGSISGAVGDTNTTVSLTGTDAIMAAGEKMLAAATVLLNTPLKAQFSRRSFEDAQEDFDKKQTARNRGALY